MFCYPAGAPGGLQVGPWEQSHVEAVWLFAVLALHSGSV
jgi:hypothetical protein